METKHSEEPKVSVIMSCYNASKTLRNAVDSVLKNTYKNIELIIIDDCSTDNSYKMAEEYLMEDDRVKVIHHEKNLGAGISRRDGIEFSTGDYICFCDSDDKLLPKHIESLVNAAIKYDADIVTSGYIVTDGKTGEFMENRKADKLTILEGNNKYAVLKADILRFLNPSLIKRHLWDKVTYSDRRYVEDSPTLIKLLWYANKRVVLPESTYIYYQNESSLTHTTDPFKDILFQTLCMMDSYDFFANEVNHPEYVPDKGVIYKLSEYLVSMPTEEHKKQYKKEIQEVKRFMIDYYEKKFE